MVERSPEKAGVPSSILGLGTILLLFFPTDLSVSFSVNIEIMIKNFVKNTIFIFLLLFLFFLFLEIGLRLYEKFCRHVSFFESLDDYRDPVLGWKGKKVFGDSASPKYKILLIGDSYTAGRGVQEEDRYYKALKNQLNAELFIYAGMGYGTLQEYLILEESYDEIRPDLIVLQICQNDFINNSWELESKSYVNNNQRVRPYFRNGRIEYLFPNKIGKQEIILASYSRFFYRLFTILAHLKTDLAKKHYFGMHTVEETIISEGMNLGEFSASVKTTDFLVRKMKDKSSKTPIVAFAVDDEEPYLTAFRDIFVRNGIVFIDKIPSNLKNKENAGVKLRLEDSAHWNAEGQQIAGNTLAAELFRLGYHK